MDGKKDTLYKDFKIEKHFTVIIVIITVVILGILLTNILTEGVYDGVRDFIIVSVLMLTGSISSYFYIRNLKRWRRYIIEQNDELELIFANTMEGILLIDKEGTIINSNNFANKLLAVKDTDIKGEHISKVFQYDNKDIFKLRRNVEKYNSCREAMPIYRQDGSSFIAEVSASVTHKKTGEELFCIVIKDETETTEYLNRINASEKTYRDLLNNVQDAIFIQDREGKIIQANASAARMFGYDLVEFKGKMPKEILSSQSFEQFEPELLKQAFDGERKIFNRWAQKKDGTIFPIETTLSKGKFFGEDVAIGIIRDISDRHESIKELQEANKQNKVLLQEIHHRVKNNMALISGLLNLQSFDVDDPYIQSILVKSQRRIHAVADVHEFLYQSKDLVSLDFKSYLDSFVKNYSTAVNSTQPVDILLNSPSFILNVNQAIPTALLLNEILLTSGEQSSSQNGRRQITIDIQVIQDNVYIDITEMSGITRNMGDIQSSLGRDIIRNLSLQLDANLKTSYNGQNRYEIEFKRKRNICGSSSNLSLN